MQIIFWQKNLSIHQSEFIKSLAMLDGVEVTLVVEHQVSERRIKMGWQAPDYAPAKVITVPIDKGEYDKFLDENVKHGFHIISGLLLEGFFYQLIKKLQTTNFKIGILTESYKHDDLLGWLRLLRTIYKIRSFRSRIDFFLSIGNTTTKQLKLMGFQTSKIYPFGYFVGGIFKQLTSSDFKKRDGRYEIIYVGSLVKWKGVSYLIQSLSNVAHLNISLTIIGDGPLKSKLINETKRLGIEAKVEWKSNLSNVCVKEIISYSDLLVLPSTYDGWGAVVSEALMVGTPVICSNKAGASILIKASGFGKVFPSKNVNALTKSLEEVINEGKTELTRRENIISWSNENISPNSAADYFLNILKHVNGDTILKPVAPWLNK